MACIRKLKNRRYQVDYRIGFTRKRVLFDTKGEAERFKRDLLLLPLERLTGVQRIQTVLTRVAVEKYLEEVTCKKSPGTQELERKALGDFVQKYGKLALHLVTFDVVDSYQSDLRRTLAPSTVNRIFNILKHFFNRCVLWKFIPDSPAADVKHLKDDRQKSIRTLTTDEIQRIISESQPWLADIVFFMALTGVRRKEACCIRWSSVDFIARTFCIESHLGFHPKGYKPRVIPLSEQALQFMKEKQVTANKSRRFGPDQQVFLLDSGKPIRPEAVTCALNRIGKKIGIPNLGPHLLRHSFCSMLVMKNESVEKIRRIAGHSSLATTQRYLTLVPNDLVESMETASTSLKLSR